MKKMKRIVILLSVIFFPMLLHGQEKVEGRLELKNGNVLTGLVQVQSDGYYLETPSGDVFLFSPSEVSKMERVNTPQQEIVSSSVGPVFRDGGVLRFSSNGQALTQSDFTSFQDWDKYQKAQRLRRTGNFIMLWGTIASLSVAAIVSASLWAADGFDAAQFGFSVGVLGGGGAEIALGTGLIIKSSGNSRLNKIAEAYNQHPGYVLNFGVQQHGVGFALNF